MDTDSKKPFMKPSKMASRKTQEEEPMTCERLLTHADAVRNIFTSVCEIFYPGFSIEVTSILR